MKITLNLSDAKKAFNQALRTCDTKAKDRLESDFIFTVSSDTVKVTSLNNFAEQTIVLRPEKFEGQEGETFSVSGQSIVDILKGFPDHEDNVVCGYSPDKGLFGVATEDGSIQFAFNTSLPEGYAPMRFEPMSSPVTLNGYKLGAALSNTAYAASTDGSQAPLTAVRVTVAADQVHAVATDTERIAGASLQLDEPITGSYSFTIPKEVSESLGTLLGGTTDVELTLGRRHVRIEWHDTQFTTLQERGDSFAVFDDADKCLLGFEVAVGVIDRHLLIKALKRASTVAKDAALTIELIPDRNVENGGKVRISTNERDKGLSKEDIDLTHLDFETADPGNIDVIVPCKQILRAVEAITDETADLSVRTMPNGKYALLVSDPAGENQHLVFPVTPKLNEE